MNFNTEILLVVAGALCTGATTSILAITGWTLLEVIRLKTNVATLSQRVKDLPCHPNGTAHQCPKEAK